jgi:Glycosidases
MSGVKAFLLVFFCAFMFGGFAQNVSVEPPSWWVGMANPNLQLMIHGHEVGKMTVQTDYPDVRVTNIVTTDNSNYLFVELSIGKNARAGTAELVFNDAEGKAKIIIPYVLNARREGSAARKGFDNADVIYMLMPDRFANGDLSNDSVPEMLEAARRSDPDGRHGGDLQGVINNLDYFNDLGVTTLWLTPVLQNNQPNYSYHGYSITDFYEIDPRLGSNELYRDFVKKAHEKDLKVVKDMVFNHFGSGHKWMNDLPSKDWIHQWENFTRTNYRGSVISDPYASHADRDLMEKGWFDVMMPDMNQKDTILANYLIQNTIWWIEYADIDGVRMDTYPYSDKMFLKSWMERVHLEYPNFNVLGEVWLNHKPLIGYWQQGAANKDGYDSELDIVMDFPLKFAIDKALTTEAGWDTGLAAIYESLSQDFIYPNPDNVVVFLDNHDLNRVYTTLGENPEKLKLALTFITTTRGIPQIWMGTEALVTGWEHEGHGKMRTDFQGGFDADMTTVFPPEGRTEQQNDVYNHLQRLLNYRLANDVLQTGKLTHFIPENNVYVYFRENAEKTVMVILNANHEPVDLDMQRYADMLNGYKKGKDILAETEIMDLDVIPIPPLSSMVIEFEK